MSEGSPVSSRPSAARSFSGNAEKIMSAASGSSDRPRVKVTLSGFSLESLIDTGAAISVMQLATYQTWRSAINKHSQLQQSPPLQSVTGTLLDWTF